MCDLAQAAQRVEQAFGIPEAFKVLSCFFDKTGCYVRLTLCPRKIADGQQRARPEKQWCMTTCRIEQRFNLTTFLPLVRPETHITELPNHDGQPQAYHGVSVGLAPIQRRVQIGLLAHQPVIPLMLLPIVEVQLGRLGQHRTPPGVPALHVDQFAVLGQLLPRVLANRLKKKKACAIY